MHRPNLEPIRMLMRIAVLHCCLVIGGDAFAQQPLGNLAGAVTDLSLIHI